MQANKMYICIMSIVDCLEQSTTSGYSHAGKQGVYIWRLVSQMTLQHAKLLGRRQARPATPNSAATGRPDYSRTDGQQRRVQD